MLLLPLLALFSLPFCLARTREQVHDELVKLSVANNGLIVLDDRTYGMLTAPDRDWTSTIVFTAMDARRKCMPCKSFQPSFEAVARAWNKVPTVERNKHFFATADFDQAMTVFQRLGIQSAPVVQMYPATEGARKPTNGKTSPLTYDFANGYDAEPLAEQLSRHTPVRIPYSPPIDWMKYGTFGATLIFAVSALRFISPLLKSRWLWAIITIGTMLTMTGGYMFVRIRGMPWTGDNGHWIAAGYQNQFGQETQVVAMIYGLLGSAFLMLTMVAPYQLSPRRQQVQIWLWSAVILIMFSVQLSLFRAKNRGYPFKLLL